MGQFLFLILTYTLASQFVFAREIVNPQTGRLLEASDIKEEFFQEDYIIDPIRMEIIQDKPKVNELKTTFKSGYNITGAYASYIRPECHYTRLQSLIRNSYETTSDMGHVLQSWFANCNAELSRFSTSPLVSLLNYQLVNYPFRENPLLKKITFTYDDDQLKIRAILGLKDSQKRPLVIVRNGVYGNASETAVSRSFIMHLLDESPFHVLFLGNVTGDVFIKDNGYLAMGGFDEGRQFHKIIDQITAQDSPYSNYIEDIHVMAVSLGANGALFSGLYDTYSQKQGIKSIVAMCPVVNLENSLNNVFSDSPIGKIYSLITYNLLKNVFRFVPILGELLVEGEFWSQSEVTNAVREASIRSYIRRTQKTPWDLAPFEGVRIESEEQFWHLNDFVKYAQNVNVPSLVVHARDDFIVPSKVNTDLLSKQLVSQKSQIATVELQNGSHCAFNVANGWPTISTLLREFVLKHSSYKVQESLEILPLQYVRTPKKSSNLMHAQYKWLFEDGKFKLSITYLDKTKRDEQARPTCRRSDYRFANGVFCYTTYKYEVKKDSFSSLGIQVPQSAREVDVVIRWLNTHVSPVSSKGDLLYGQTEVPTHIKVLTQFKQD